MRSRYVLALGLIGLGFVVAAPSMTPVARAADDAAKADKGGERRGRGERGGGPGRMLDRYHQAVTALNLTAEQKPTVDAAFAAAKEKVDAALKDAGQSQDRKAAREKIRPIMEDLRRQVNDVLTAEQKTQLEKAREERRSRRGQGRGRDGQSQ